MDPLASPALASGALIASRYRVQRLLQADLGGRRYLADDTQAGTGAVALHVLVAPALRRADERREAASWLDGVLARLRQVQHPVLAPVVEGWADPAPGGPFYLAQLYVPGPTLADELEEQEAITWRTAVDWALALCDLLSRLHGLQPPHVLGHLHPRHLVLDSRTAAPVVVDLGFASGLAGRPWDNGGYTPLEQYISRPSPRSDVYALGALLHTLLSGHDPDAALARRLRAGQDLQRALRTLFPPLDPRALGLPPALAPLIARATAFVADDRFQDVSSLADALQSLLGPAVSTAPSAAPAEDVPVWQQLGLSRDAWFALAPPARNAALLQLMGRQSASSEAAWIAPPPVAAVAPPVAPAPPSTHLRVDAGGHSPYRTIASALTAAGPAAHIEIAPGRYREALRLDRAVDVRGPETGEAVIRESHDEPCLTIAAPGVVVRGITFRHAGAVAAVECLADAVFEHCALVGGAPAVAVRGEGVVLTLRHCSIAEGPGDGVQARDGARIVLEDCTIAGRGRAGIHLLRGTHVQASRCAVRDGDGAGLVCETATRGTVEACEIVGNGGVGVDVAAPAGLIIRSCRIGYNGGPAIALNGDGPVTVEACDLSGNIGGAWRFPDDGDEPPTGLVRNRNRE